METTFRMPGWCCWTPIEPWRATYAKLDLGFQVERPAIGEPGLPVWLTEGSKAVCGTAGKACF